MGVRDMVEPPTPTFIPSWTKLAASWRETTFSRKLRSRCDMFSLSRSYGSTKVCDKISSVWEVLTAGTNYSVLA